MTEYDVTRVLSQIRSLQQQVARPAAPAASEAAPAASFASTLGQALDSVAQAQNRSSALQGAFERGDPKADLVSVMLAGAQAQVQFRAAVEVRNRLVSAYQDVMNMPI
ncbi:MAG TPA: flagellar hook-basal body complex protein FliE [Nevskiaceae bacterium]|nr:flagellar hook-basal body complex protein FliE [Nevskiaceae bacterium]